LTAVTHSLKKQTEITSTQTYCEKINDAIVQFITDTDELTSAPPTKKKRVFKDKNFQQL